ncbi:MAG: hypothetical protein M3P83_02785 [Actinomycetota bacterium]|nr:hypothetical protein [Actinomycetota bacterium]
MGSASSPRDDEPEFRMLPIWSALPEGVLGEPFSGERLLQYVAHEELFEEHLEYRRGPHDVWLDASAPETPAPRETPELSRSDVNELRLEHPGLADIPYAEPLVFLAACSSSTTFWRRAVAAGWAPSQEDLALMIWARKRITGPDGLEPAQGGPA